MADWAPSTGLLSTERGRTALYRYSMVVMVGMIGVSTVENRLYATTLIFGIVLAWFSVGISIGRVVGESA